MYPETKTHSKLNKYLAITLLLTLIAAFNITIAPKVKASGTTYYVDNCVVTGNDSNNGTSTSTPWLTIAHVNSYSFNPGDTILFRSGCTWREALTPGQSGTAGNPITFGAYGSGANPIISGANVFSSWTSEGISFSNGHDFTNDTNGDKPTSWWLFQDASSPALDGSSNGNNIPWASGSCSRSSNYPAGFGTKGIYSLNTPYNCYVQTLAYNSLSANFPYKASTTAVTLGGWVYLIANSGNTYQAIANFGDGSTRGWKIRISPTANQIQLLVAGVGNITANAGYSVSGWHHVVFRWNGADRSGAGANNETSLWVDGVKQTSVLTSGTPVLTTSADTLTLNGTSIAATNWDEWFVAPVAYTDTEIQQIYNDGLTGTGSGTTSFTDYYTSVTTQPYFVLDNGSSLTPASSVDALTPSSFFWDSGTNLLHVRLAGDANPSGHTIQASQRRTVGNGALAYITVQNLNLTMSNNYGIIFANNLTVQGCSISYTYDPAIDNTYGYTVANGNTITHAQLAGIQVSGGNNVVSNNTISFTGDEYSIIGTSYPTAIVVSYPGSSDSGSAIFGNLVHDTYGSYPYSHGIYLGQYASNVQVYNNDIYNSFDGSDISYRANGGNVYDNTLSSSYVGGISLVENLAMPIAGNIYNNLIYGNHYGIGEGAGVQPTAPINVQIYNNTFYQNSLPVLGNPPIEIQLVDNLTSVAIENNIFWATSTANIIWSVTQSAMTANHNIYFRSDTPTGTFYYNGVEENYSWWAANVDSSPFTNPLLNNPSGGIFTLQSSSTAIDAGVNLGTVYDMGLDPSSSWPSSIILDNQYINGTGWDIGAYIYPNPDIPAVAVSAPTPGSVVSGTAIVTANATSTSQSSIISSVLFYLDTTFLGTSVSTTSPSFSWNTQNTTNGSHTLVVVATDNYGNTNTSSPVSLNVSNGGGYFSTYPTITGEAVSSITPTSALVSWNSYYPGSSEIDYGTTTNFNLTVATSTIVNAHSLTLTNLLPNTTYHYILKSTYNTLTSTFGPASFTTLKAAISPTPASTAPTSTTSPTSTPQATASPSLLKMPLGWGLTMPTGQGSSSFPLLTQTLSYGSHGLAVINLQNILKALGLFPNSTLSNGIFGTLTLKTVKTFQLQYHIASPGQQGYGVVGKKTRAVLNSLVGK
jgi:hypothetical protein